MFYRNVYFIFTLLTTRYLERRTDDTMNDRTLAKCNAIFSS